MVCDHCIHTPIFPHTLPMPSHSHPRTLAHQGPKAEFKTWTEADPGDAYDAEFHIYYTRKCKKQ